MANRDNKRSLRQKIQDFMSTPKGQTIMNYAYNWGASVVIMGTLFKLTHLPGANFMLFAGMGTEVLIFFLSAFDLSGVKRKEETGDSMVVGAIPAGTVVAGDAMSQQGATPVNTGAMLGGNVATAGGSPSIVVVQGGGPVQAGAPVPSVQSVADPVQLKAMTEMLSRCTEQAQTISQDTEQMNLLSKNLAGINAIYEMQLRSVSTQIGTIDQVHEQTRRMARQIEELNEVYARMLQAMTSK